MSRTHALATLFAAASFVALGGCATGESKEEVQYAESFDPLDEVVCRRQRVVGSHLPKRVCRTKRQMEEDRIAALEAVGPLRTMGGSEPKRPTNAN